MNDENDGKKGNYGTKHVIGTEVFIILPLIILPKIFLGNEPGGRMMLGRMMLGRMMLGRMIKSLGGRTDGSFFSR